MKSTNTGGIPANVGYPKGMQGTINKAVTREHLPSDEGKVFTDNFGRDYTYSPHGLMYHQIKNVGE